MKQGVRAKCRRITSGFLAFIMVFMLVLGDAGTALASEYGERFFQDGFGLLDEDEYSDTVSTKASFKNHTENGVTISVSASDDSDFRAGGEVYLDVHVKNESNGMITDGVLNFQGRKLKDSGAYFEELTEDAVTEGIMENAGYEEEDEDNGSQEVDLINDLEDNSQATLPVHKDESETPSVRDDGADKESIVNEAAGNGQESAEGTEGGTEEEIKNIESQDNGTEEETDTEHNENVTVTENNVVSEDQNSINVEGNDENANAAAGEVTTAGESNSAEPANDANIAGGTEDNKDPWLDEFDESEDGERRREILAGESRGDNKKKNGDEEDEEEDDGPLQEIEDIQLAPGQIYSVRFVYTVDESIENAKNQHVVFRFSGKDEDNKNIRQQEMFYYTANYLNAGEVRFKDGNRVRTGDEITMGIHTGVYDFDILLGDDEVKAELASRSDAEKASASDAQKATASNAQKATASDATKYTDPDEKEEDEEDDEEDNDDFKVDLGDTIYKIEMTNARLNGFKARKALVEDANDNMLICTYRVSKNVKPGIYFGKVIQESKVKGKTFKSSQGFALIVKGSGEMALEGELGDIRVKVEGPVESFPDVDQLSVLVSEVEEEQKSQVDEALQKKVQEEGIEIQSYKALDIKLYADGKETEPIGPVKVTFENIKLEDTLNLKEAGGEENVMALSLEESETREGSSQTPAEAAGEGEIKIYHLDESQSAANEMQTTVEDGNVVMDTDHFSVFVIVVAENKQNEEFHLIFEHRLGTKSGDKVTVGKKLYLDTWPMNAANQRVKIGKNYNAITGFERALNFEALQIQLYKMKTKNGEPVITNYNYQKASSKPYKTVDLSSAASSNIQIDRDTIAVVAYKEKNMPTFTDPVKFYDYDYSGTDSSNDTYYKGINYTGNYKGGNKSQRIGVGLNVGTQQYTPQSGYGKNHAFNDQDYKLVMNNQLFQNGDANGGANGGINAIRTGIVSKLTGTNYGTVVYGKNSDGKQIYDPGLFTDEKKEGKKVLTNYALHFDQTGNSYSLNWVQNMTPGSKHYTKGKYNKAKGNKNNFFPLNDVSGAQYFKRRDGNGGWTGDNLNWFFGMRYDLTFELNDYIGDLTYTFSGDDDVWVFLDGNLILDMGGIHTLYPDGFKPSADNKNTDWRKWRNTVNLWSFLNGKTMAQYDPNAAYDYAYATTEKGKKEYTKTHRITVLYMERGGYDSNCEMDFVLPNVRPLGFTTSENNTTSVTVKKEWKVKPEAILPGSITVRLMQDGERYVASADVPLNSTNNWTYKWENLPKGHTYTVKEINKPDGFKPTVGSVTGDETKGYKVTITNVQTRNLKVRKEWDDYGDADKTRPGSVQVQLYKKYNGSEEAEGTAVTLSSSNGWKHEWKNKPLFDNSGNPIDYYVREVEAEQYWLKSPTYPNGWYEVSYSGDAIEGFLVKNTYERQYTEKTVKKVWKDNENKVGVRPEKIQVQLLKDGSPLETVDLKPESWSYTWTAASTKLPKYKFVTEGGKIVRKEIVYTLKELSYDNDRYYTVQYSPEDTKGQNVTITNNIQAAKLRLKKVVAPNGLSNEPINKAYKFLIRLIDTEGREYTSVALGHLEESGNIFIMLPDKAGKEFTIREIVPMEYEMTRMESNQSGSLSGTSNGSKVTVNPGDSILVTLNNRPDHTGYFHHTYSVTNEKKAPVNESGNFQQVEGHVYNESHGNQTQQTESAFASSDIIAVVEEKTVRYSERTLEKGDDLRG